MELKELMDLRQYLKVAHHIPGRIRLRFATKLLTAPALREVREKPEGLVKTLFGVDALPQIDGAAMAENPAIVPGIKDVRLNLTGRSIVMEYDPVVWEPSWLDEMMMSSDENHLSSLANTMLDNFLKRMRKN